MFLVFFAFPFTTAPTHALSNDPDAQLRTFAACVGRLSAVLEHEWNNIGAVSSETALKRDAAAEIVAAIVSEERSRDILEWRNAAKLAQHRLLSRALTTHDAAEAAWALQQAEHYETACASLLIL
ncbi:MAG: hypothetical protein AAFQ09_03840 [Pseudomonadota bacterium]